MSRKKRRAKVQQVSADLNIMPFIDIFSMLNTFLLVSAAFINIGLIEVQVPFLTNAPPPKDKPQRSLVINIAVDKEGVDLETRWTAAPINETKKRFEHTKQGLDDLHLDLVQLRQKHPSTDKVDIYSEDDVKYKKLVEVLDSVMVKRDSDPEIVEKDVDDERTRGNYIYRKVVMAGVIL